MPSSPLNASRLLRFLVIGGVAVLALAVLALKDRPQPTAPLSSEALPAAQLERARSAGQPALAFFHSNNCEQCLVMIDMVAQVYPEFAGVVALVDVDVYDAANAALLKEVRLQTIPMLVFYDREGKRQSHIGMMEAGELRQELCLLAGGQ